MTRLLLSASERLKRQVPDQDRTGVLRSVFNFFYATQALRLLTLLWLYWTFNKYLLLQQRPSGIFWFDHALVNWLMPSFPSPALFYGVLVLALVCNVWQLLRQKNNVVLQLMLALSLLWLNLPQWGYGFLSHVNYTFLLAHLFLTFIPISKAALKLPTQYMHRCIMWFYAGILFTYTLAGLWKIPTLLYKLVTGSPDVHWLHPHASLFNAFVSYRNFDLSFTLAPLFTDHALFWQLSFLVVVYIQSSSIFAAFRQELRPLMGLLLVIFHAMNMLVFETYFVVATLVILCLFTPYDLFLSNKFKRLAADKVETATCKAHTPFEAFREKLRHRNFYLSGPLYLPGVRTLADLFITLKDRP